MSAWASFERALIASMEGNARGTSIRPPTAQARAAVEVVWGCPMGTQATGM